MLWKKHRVFGAVLAMVLVLLIGTSWHVVLGPSLSYAATAATLRKVDLSGERIEQSSAATADFDGDGRKEIVIGGRDGMLYVITYNDPSGSVVWSRQVANDLNAAGAPSAGCVTTKSDIRSAPAIGDLDGDGHLEIVVSVGGDPAQHRNGGVLVYRYNSAWAFSLVSGWPQPKTDLVGQGSGSSYPDGCWDGFWSTPALGDIDGDSKLEVVVEGFDRKIHAWHFDGNYVSSWPIYRYNGDNILRGGWSSPALGDIDGDGLPEVVVGTDSPPWDGHSNPDYTKSTVWAINGDSTSVPGWPATTEQTIQSSPALGDIDGDGQFEIVVGTGNSIAGTGGYKVYAWNGDGALASGWPKSTNGNMPASPALGDLDGDGDLEVVIGCGTEGDSYNPAPCTSLYAWHGNGSPVSGFPTSPQNNTGWPADPNGLPYSPILADYDGDGSVEILAVNRWSWGISTVGSNGSNRNDSTLRTDNTLSSSPVVDDVDNDSKLEIIIGGASSSGTTGVVYIWDGLNGSASSALPWPMFHRDVRRTGRYLLPPKLGFPTDVRLFHQWGSGETETGYQLVRNEGEGNFNWRITNVLTNVRVNPSSSMVTTTVPTQFVVTTTGLLTGWHILGTVQVTGTINGQDVLSSPIISAIHIYVGDVTRVYLPLVLRNH